MGVVEIFHNNIFIYQSLHAITWMPLFCKSIKWSCVARAVRWVSALAVFSFFLLVFTYLGEDKINLTMVVCLFYYFYLFIYFVFCDVKIFVFFLLL